MRLPGIGRRAFLTVCASGASAALAAWYGRGFLRRSLTEVRNSFRPPLRVRSLAELDRAPGFEVAIVGSGPAGAILGRELAERGVRTLVVESGPNLADPSGIASADESYRALERYRSSGSIAYPLAATRLRAVGGTSSLWTGRCSRLHPGDFRRNALTPEGAAWPISYGELEPYYDLAEQTLRVRGGDLSSYHAPRSGPLPLRGDDETANLRRLMEGVGVTVDPSPTSTGLMRPGGPMRTGPDILPYFTAHENAMLVAGATVTRLRQNTSGEIDGLELRSFDGHQRTLEAGRYVVAAGAVETARLLLLSTSTASPQGIGNDHDLVGRFFGEHPNLTVDARLPSPHRSTEWGELGRCHQFYDEFKRAGFGSVVLRFGLNPGGDRLIVGASLEMEPSADNRVTLDSDALDLHGNPGTVLNFGFSAKDLQTLARARGLIQRICSDLAATDAAERPEIEWSHHHVGTCRMGSDPSQSVVDRNLQVHSAPNLFLASSAVFTTGGAAHPTLTIAALSHRLADHLAPRARALPTDLPGA